jgi:hypothetical protein
MSQSEKQTIITNLDSHLNRLQSSINSNISLQANTSYLIGSILLGTYGVIVLGFLKPPGFLFSRQEANIAIMIFILFTVSYLSYFYFNFLFNFKKGIKKTKEFTEKIPQWKKINIHSIHSVLKPSLYMTTVCTISSFLLILSFSEQKIIFTALIISMIFLSLEITFIYFIIKKYLKNTPFKTLINYNIILSSQLKNKSILSLFKEKIRTIIIDNLEKCNFFEKFIFITYLFVLLILLSFFISPLVISWILPICYLLQSFDANHITGVLILLTLVLQFILIYPLRKYFFLGVEIENHKKIFEKLDELRKKILFDKKYTFEDASKSYEEILNEFPFS